MTPYLRTLAAAVAAVLCAAAAAPAAEYPDRPITLMVNYGAGGATDFQARIMTAGADEALGQPMVIVNKPGAGGRVGWNWFATEARADGYALSTYNVPSFIAQSIRGGVQYSAESFEPIANWGADPAVIIVPADSPFRTIGELVERARAEPGRVTVSGGGLHNGHHIALLQLEEAAGVRFAYIPTKTGAVESMKAVMAGEVMAGVNNLSDAFRAREAGNIRILAVADTARDEAFIPDVPTLAEAGYDVDDSSVNFRGIMAPAGTPPEIVALLAEKVVAMFRSEETRGRMREGGAPVRIMGREEVQKMWRERQDYLSRLLAGL